MLDDLRDDSVFLEEDEEDDAGYDYQDAEASSAPTSETLILGMTAPQRFVISFLVLLMVAILGFFFLVITGAVQLPFLAF